MIGTSWILKRTQSQEKPTFLVISGADQFHYLCYLFECVDGKYQSSEFNNLFSKMTTDDEHMDIFWRKVNKTEKYFLIDVVIEESHLRMLDYHREVEKQFTKMKELVESHV